MNEQLIHTAATQLREARSTGVPCPPVRNLLPDMDLACAYEVQQANTAFWLSQGQRRVGAKTGLTSRTVQQQLRVDQPDFGMLFASMWVADADPIAADAVLQPKVEAEVALVLERDLKIENPTVVDMINAVAYALPAIEIVGSRVANWDINIVDTIADNASSGLFVLGNEPRKLQGLDLRLCGMVMERRGEVISSGAGVACLGHPLNAATWLAKTLYENGSPLLAGDIILTGALGPMISICSGDTVEARISGLGSVRASFSPNELTG
jgi:2-keto-4-pentenoate hydratase